MAEKSLLVGDEAADLLLSSAASVARTGRGDQVSVRAIGAHGDELTVVSLLNSGAVLLVESTMNRLNKYDGLEDDARPFDAVAEEG